MPAQRFQSAAINLALVLASLLFVLAACEGGIRLLQWSGQLPVYNKKSIDKGETPNRHLNARLVRSDNPVLFMEYDRNDPNINNAGFRGPDFTVAKTPGTTRIAILGDSVAYGYSVAYEDTFAARLAQQLNARGNGLVEVLNFAVSGYSTIAELELYKTRVREYDPDIVLLAYVLNDPLPAAFVVQSVGAARQQVDLFKVLSRYSQLGAWAYLRWQKLVQPFDRQRNYRSMYSNPESWQRTVAALAELQQLVRDDGAQLYAVVFPLLLDFGQYPMQDIHAQVNGALAQLGIPHIDLLDDYRQIPYLELRPHPNDDTHPNARGHAIAAGRIAGLLRP